MNLVQHHWLQSKELVTAAGTHLMRVTANQYWQRAPQAAYNEWMQYCGIVKFT
jgi:hypothetical protein